MRDINDRRFMTGAEAAVKCSSCTASRFIFGLCGDTSLPFYDALARLPHGMRHILARDERSAAYMADGYARVSGKVGVCEGPSGGGVTYILPGLAEANESSVPLLVHQLATSPLPRAADYTLTELDQGALMRPVTKWNTVLDRAEDLPQAFRQAFKQITTGAARRGPYRSALRRAKWLGGAFRSLRRCELRQLSGATDRARGELGRSRRALANSSAQSGVYLRRRSRDLASRARACRTRRAALGAGGDDHQRQMLY